MVLWLALRSEKRILGASQDLERFVIKMRKVYSSCKESECISVYNVTTIWRRVRVV
jgi:hypothetical protein